jgi:hypothetical protein
MAKTGTGDILNTGLQRYNYAGPLGYSSRLESLGYVIRVGQTRVAINIVQKAQESNMIEIMMDGKC